MDPGPDAPDGAQTGDHGVYLGWNRGDNGGDAQVGFWFFGFKHWLPSVVEKDFPAGMFFEGGINLTRLGLSGCFAALMAETRLSPKEDAPPSNDTRGSFEILSATVGGGASPAGIRVRLVS